MAPDRYSAVGDHSWRLSARCACTPMRTGLVSARTSATVVNRNTASNTPGTRTHHVRRNNTPCLWLRKCIPKCPKLLIYETHDVRLAKNMLCRECYTVFQKPRAN